MKSFIFLHYGISPSRIFKPIASGVIFTLLIAVPLFAQWEPDSQLTFDTNISYTSYNNAWCVAANGDTIHVVFYDDRDNTFFDIYYKRSTDAGITWSPDARLTNHTVDTYANSPSVAVAGSIVHVVWCDGRDGNPEIYYKRSPDCGATWGADIPLTQDDSSSYYPSMTVTGTQVHVVWRDNRGGGCYEIYYKHSTDGGVSWGADTRLTTDAAESWYPSVAVSGNNVHVVWPDDRDGNGEIYYKRSTDNGTTWDADLRMTNAPSNSDFTSIAASGSDVHIVWRDYRDGNMEIYCKRSTDNGTAWGYDTRLTGNSNWSVYPSVAVSGSNVHVVWNDNRDGNMEIYYKFSTDRGTTWSADTRLTNAIRFSRKPSLAISDSMVHVVWEDNRWDPSENFEIVYKCNPTGNPVIGVEEDDLRDSRMPATELNTVPNPFASFTTIPGHDSERFALYDVAGQRVGTFRGDRIGEGLVAGIYFVKPECSNGITVRIVKIR